MQTSSLKEYVNRDRSVHDHTCNGKCSECGECCGNFLPISEREIHIISAYIKRRHIKEQKEVNNVLQSELLDLTCPFLDKSKPDKKCTIYGVRPLICKEFKCDNPMNPSNEMFSENRFLVNMRHCFFTVSHG